MDTEHTISRDGKTAIVRGEQTPVAEALLARTGCVPWGGHGRGDVFRFPLPNGPGILRPYRRGGFVRYFMDDAYLLVNRPLREWRIHVFLFDRGFPVPEPLGVMWERKGAVFRGAFATRAVEAVDIEEFTGQNPGQAEGVLVRVGEAIRTLHDLGVYHADLQVRNILVTSGDARILFIDFDNARRCARLSDIQRARNLLRLRRSCDKNGMTRQTFDAIFRGYGQLNVPWWLDQVYRLKGSMSDATAGREQRHAP